MFLTIKLSLFSPPVPTRSLALCLCTGHGGAAEVSAAPGSTGEEPTETHEKSQGEYTGVYIYICHVI